MSKNIRMKSRGVIGDYNGIQTIYAGSDLWVPEDEEEETGQKTITSNGVYLASDDGLAGWSQVTVDVANETPEIYFFREPRLYYIKGDEVDLTGAEVHAKYPDGTETDITDQCEFYPPQGTVVKSSEFTIIARWKGGS